MPPVERPGPEPDPFDPVTENVPLMVLFPGPEGFLGKWLKVPGGFLL